jgi:hypothetical protein
VLQQSMPANNFTTTNADIIYVDIYWNGTLIQSRHYTLPTWSFGNGSVGASNVRLPTRITAPLITAIFLPAGTNTFEVRARCNFLINPGMTGATFDAGGFIALVNHKTTLN